MGEPHSEILYTVLNYVGKDAERVRPSLLEYFQTVFRLDEDQLQVLLQAARERQRPEIQLNAIVMEATLRKPTDVNGFSDPYCVLYLASNPEQRCTTSIQLETLTPVWNETFEFPLEDPMGEVLCLEIWDFDEEESVKEKMKKLREVKNVRGLKVYLKEVKLAVASGRSSIINTNELIGSSLVSLKDIPSSGVTLTCRLDKNGKVRKLGDLTVHLSFSLKTDEKTALEQYRYLLYNVLLQELRATKDEFYKWTGELSTVAQTLLTRHEAQCRVSPLQASLARWIEHVHIHEHHPLNLNLFLPLLRQLVTPLEDNALSIEEKMLFWEAVTKLLPSCLMTIRRLQMMSLSRKTVSQPLVIIQLISMLAKISQPANINLFPRSRFSWLLESEDSNTSSIPSVLQETVSLGAKEWFMQILESKNIHGITDEDEQLNGIIAVLEATSASVQNTLDYYEETFQESFHFSYAGIIYKIYQISIMELVEPIVTQVCKSMKPIIFNDSSEEGIYDNDPLTVGSTLFVLYKRLRTFSEFGLKICHQSADPLLSNKFLDWFNPALVQWLYISSYTAKHQIQTAVKLDHNDNSVLLITTSAVDVLDICEKIKIFWNDLAWPEPRLCCVLFTRLIEDTCECLSFYGTLMVTKAQSLIDNDPRIAKRFRITHEWCFIINNIRHIQNKLPNYIQNFKLDEMTMSDNGISTDDWKLSVLSLINNYIAECNVKIEEIMSAAVQKLSATVIRQYVSVDEMTRHTDELLDYLDDSLNTLHDHLHSMDFELMIKIIWKELCHLLYDLVHTNMQIGRQRSFFTTIQELAEKLLEFFSQPASANLDMNEFYNLRRLLNMNSMSTHSLIQEYYLQQLAKQKAVQVPQYGYLTIRAQFLDDILRLEIMSGRHLQPICPSGMCDPYVKVSFLPEEKFANIGQLKTKILNKTTTPLFEERFEIQLTREQRDAHNGMLLFTVKQVILLKNNYILGETLLSFDDIPSTSMFSNFDSLAEKQLTICRPTVNDSDLCTVLKHKEDKTARDFIKTRTNRYPQSR